MDKVKVAGELVKIARELTGYVFPNKGVMEQYFKDHPDADRSKHSVRPPEQHSSLKKKKKPGIVEKLKHKLKKWKNKSVFADESSRIEAAKEMVMLARELTAVPNPKKGDTIWYGGGKAEVTGKRDGQYGPVWDLKLEDGGTIRGAGPLDPRFGAKSKSDINKRMKTLQRELRWAAASVRVIYVGDKDQPTSKDETIGKFSSREKLAEGIIRHAKKNGIKVNEKNVKGGMIPAKYYIPKGDDKTFKGWFKEKSASKSEKELAEAEEAKQVELGFEESLKRLPGPMRKEVAGELVKLAKELVARPRTAMTEKAVKKLIDKVNRYIAKSNKDDVLAVEPDSTWESAYEFKPVKMSGKNVVFEYTEPYGNKKNRERFNYENDEDDLKWQFRWVIRAIKKGYKTDGLTPPKF